MDQRSSLFVPPCQRHCRARAWITFGLIDGALDLLDALTNVLATDTAVAFSGRQASTMEAWQAECTTLGLIDRKAKPDSARALFSKFRRELVACNMVGCEGDYAWLIR